MNRRQKIIVSITGIFIVLLALVGLTYAYFLTQVTGNSNPKSVEVTTANLSVTYNDDMDGDGEPDALMVFENIQPSNTATYTKTFKVENTGNAKASYSVILDNMVNDFDRNQDLKYTLTRVGTTGNVAEGNLVVGTKQILLPKAEIEKDITHEYTLTIKYIETGTDQSIDMGKELSFRVNISEETVTWDTATNGTLLYALKNSNDSHLKSIEDDYGMSYYYKGEATNNYVTYSNMCWRIVRTQGDGTIKLALADWNHPCGTANGYLASDYDSAFISEENTPVKISYNLNGTVNQTLTINQAIQYYLYENSNIPDLLNRWSTNVNLDDSKLISTDWCNDTSVTTYNDVGYGNYLGFGANVRININNNPSLKCNFKGVENTRSTRYENKTLGVLNADEMELTKEEKKSYLIQNATHDGVTSIDLISMTPSHAYLYNYQLSELYNYGIQARTDSMGWVVDTEHKLNWEAYVRPVIVLNSNVKLSSETAYTQNGGIDTPYVIAS